MSRPTLKLGSYGPDVGLVQECLGATVDNDFGPQTEAAVEEFQDNYNLDDTGKVDEPTWAKMEEVFDLPPYPPMLLVPLDADVVAEIEECAEKSAVANYAWEDRGVAPIGYVKGMALAYATMYRKFHIADTTAHECARANTGDVDTDALAWYAIEFDDLDMSNDVAGVDTLRHLFVLLMGLGMRESSGRHCEGRDTSADNVSSDTAEAGLFQQSWNSRSCNTEIEKLFDEYLVGLGDEDVPQCALKAFKQDVSCSSDDWMSYGTGDGLDFQDLCKECPQFAVECAAVGLRNLRQHWGPINRKEVELIPEADELFLAVQHIIDSAEPQPLPPEPEMAVVRISTNGPVRVFVNGIEITPTS